VTVEVSSMNPIAACVMTAVVSSAVACQPRSGGRAAAGTNPSDRVSKESTMTTPPTRKQILFYEDDRLIDREDVETVPDSVRYVDVNGVREEVAKVVARTAGDQRFIEQYAADGRLLLRTVQIRQPRPDGG
jgi:hypothetical protein